MVVSDLNGEFWAVNETTTWKSNLGWVRLLVIGEIRQIPRVPFSKPGF